MKKISWSKHLRMLLRLTVVFTIVMLFIGGWATQMQDDMNKQIFLDSNRVANGIGIIFSILGWGMWEFFCSTKNDKSWQFISAIGFFLIATLMINGILGFVGGFLTIIIMTIIFILNLTKVLMIRGNE